MNIPIGGDSAYFLDLYARYRRDRHSVPVDWLVHFEEMEFGSTARSGVSSAGFAELLLQGYRRFGHLEAQVNPLETNDHREPALERLRAEADRRGLETIEMTLAGTERHLPIAEVEATVRSIYSGNASLEVEHLHGELERTWWYEHFERSFSSEPDEKLLAASLESIALADEFEAFMRVKFPTKKRFGIEGAETAIVFVRELLRAAALGKNPATLAAELMGRDLSEGATFTGDVPYHLGYTSESIVGDNRLRLTLLPHPSHLLVVAPVALGLARATSQAASGRGDAVLCLLLHTDAAFSGQGVAAELLQLGGLEGYSAGGAIHLVVNNQIGFTTMPSEGRSARYCTDFGKAVGAPIMHVNGDDPVAVARVARLAIEWKRAFGKDVLVDLVCYRRHGHNELDEPRFTQPGMWRLIDGRRSVREDFSGAGFVSDRIASQASTTAGKFRARLQQGFEIAAEIAPNDEPVQREAWGRLDPASESDFESAVQSGVDLARLKEIGLAASLVPESLDIHPKVRQFYEARARSIDEGNGINFATAEALALASLMAEGSRVRLSGQDTVRGTFTQRHLMVHDVSTGRKLVPLASVAPSPDAFQLVNSPLSEYGALGFEYGHSLYDPDQLTIWEAQFGDFINGAQVVVDQYIVSAEAKWRLKSGLVVILPHGLEGQGPDHSSARIERLTSLCAGANIIIAQPSTPANLFHLLRRQIRAPWRKPLFVIAPKSLLRAKAAVSTLAEMGAGTSFRSVIAETGTRPDRVRRVVLCTGKIFYALDRARREAGLDEAILPVRIEQIYPFPHAALRHALEPFARAELVWLQEEPENQGAWRHIQAELALRGVQFSAALPVVSRPAMPVCAAGSIERHEREEREILARALDFRSG
jgi:2-oxoglutarate dehydrogenase E1 component